MTNATVVNKAFKFRIYLTPEQVTLINKTIGCGRFVFNHFLGLWNNAYQETGKGLTYGACSAELTKLKQKIDWLREPDKFSLQNALRNLADSYTRFYKKQNNAPRFKSKRNPVQSYQTNYTNIHEKITNARTDFLQKESTKLINENQVICLEDLQVSHMLKNHNLAKAISDVSWSQFRAMLEYKAKWYGRTISIVGTSYPTSQLCSVCGHKHKAVKRLKLA